MAFGPDDRAEFSFDVPAYVDASADGTWRLVATDGGEVLSVEHATARVALEAARAMPEVESLEKTPNLRTNGAPSGSWLWLDATAEESATSFSADGIEHRVGEVSIWEMAASINRRESAIPVNGGGAPRGGGQVSLAHGDAITGGDHPANGYAHIGIPVYDGKRPHLFLFSELIPEIAVEVDRGRLAYGSVRFGFADTDEDDNHACTGVELISHALTNDPAVTTLTAGSLRQNGEPAHVAVRTRRSNMPNVTQRGPVADVLTKIAATLGLTLEDIEEDRWKVYDAVYALMEAKTVEDIVSAGVTAPPVVAAEAARARAALRSVEGVPDDQVEPMLERSIAFLRNVLGKPDAPPVEALDEAEARTEEIAAAVGSDARPSETPPEPTPEPETPEPEAVEEGAGEEPAPDEEPPPADDDPQDERASDPPPADEDDNPEGEPSADTEEEEDHMSEKKTGGASELEVLRAKNRELEAKNRKLEVEKAAKEKAAEERAKDNERLDKLIAERSLVIAPERRERILRSARKLGWDTVDDLGLLKDPPQAPSLDHRQPASPGVGPSDRQVEVVREAERELRQEIRDAGTPMPNPAALRRKAISRAREAHPAAFKRRLAS